MAKVTEYDVLVCTECEGNEVLAPIDSTDHKCAWCLDPEGEALIMIMERLRKPLGLTRS